MKGPLSFVVAVAAGVSVTWVGLAEGAWWLAFPVGLVIGGVLARAGEGLVAAAMAGMLGWLLPLEMLQTRYGLAPTIASLAAIVGVPPSQGFVAIVLTGVVGMLLGLTGAWLSSAVGSLAAPVWRRVVRDQRRPPASSPEVW
jgi:hypothetical protein